MKKTEKEKEAYECYMDRLSAQLNPIPLSNEECDAYNATHPLPTEDELKAILSSAK